MKPLPILMYHNIGTPPAGTLLRSLYVRETAFSRQMALLRLMGYQGLSMANAMPYLKGELTGRIVAITFDDGYLDTFEAALPVLKRNGFTATCYAVSGAIGKYNEWDAEVIRTKKPLMTASQIRQWADAGMEIGAHSKSHPFLTKCDDDELQSELVEGKSELEGIAGSEINQFCYPSGDYNERVISAVNRSGYVAATTTQRGRANPESDLFALPRVQVGGHNFLPQYLIKLITSYEDLKR